VTKGQAVNMCMADNRRVKHIPSTSLRVLLWAWWGARGRGGGPDSRVDVRGRLEELAVSIFDNITFVMTGENIYHSNTFNKYFSTS